MSPRAVIEPGAHAARRGGGASRPGRCLILTLRGPVGSAADLEGTGWIADAYRDHGWQVEWVHANATPAALGDRGAALRATVADGGGGVALIATASQDNPPPRPRRVFERLEDRVHCVLTSVAKRTGAPRATGIRSLPARVALRLVRPLRKLQDRLFPLPAPPVRSRPIDPSALPAARTVDVAALFAGCEPNDVVLLTAAEPRQLEWLLGLVPAIGADRPIAATLHVRLTSRDVDPIAKGELDLATFATRWRSGAPFRWTFLHADDEVAAAARSAQLGLRVHATGRARDVGRFGPVDVNGAVAASLPPTATVDRFGPVAMQVTALWGRAGSTSIFDSQARYLVERGFLVVRVFVEHWPHRGAERLARIDGLAAENFDVVRPHAWTVIERDEASESAVRLTTTREFVQATSMKRMLMLLAAPNPVDPAVMEWAGRHAEIAITNHLPHVPATERFTRAPIVLETHGIYRTLLASHGVPQFVPPNPGDDDTQVAEEGEVLRRVAACVTLSAEDDAFVSRHARCSAVIRPYARTLALVRRSWPVAVAANALDARFLAAGRFDIMLWGDLHDGNVTGVQWFVEQVVPTSERLRRANIVVVGRVARGLPPGFAERHRLLVAGFVDCLDDFVVRTKVLVVPDQGGSGMSMKAMEALAVGRAFVSTTSGMRCVDLGDTGYQPVDDPRRLGFEVEELLGSDRARERRAAIARILYERNFSRAAYAGAWDDVLRGAAPDALAHTSPTAPRADVARDPLPTHAEKPEHPSAGSAPRITIVICTYDRYDVLPDAIASAQSQTLPRSDFEIIVVDNSPDQALAARWAQDYADEPSIRYHLEPIPGLSNARNVGTDLARAPIVAFMDDDAIASPHWAAEIVAAFAAFPRAGIVGGRVRPRWVCDKGAPWLHEQSLGYLSIVDWGDVRRPLAPNEWAAGCNVAFARDALLEVGGFSRSLGRVGSGASLLSNEELAVAEKIHALGRISVYAPAADVEHLIDPARLTREWFRKRAAWQAVSDFIKDPKKTSAYAPSARAHLLDAQQHGARQVPLGAFHETDDKEVFKQDMDLMYDLMVACLAGGLELRPAPARDAAPPAP